MPIFEQRCNGCGYDFEVIVLSRTASEESRPCPRCKSRDTMQLASMFSSRMAGSVKLDIKRGPGHNPFENFTLHHVRDENGKPVTVNSEKELRAAEKKYNFIHAASWGLHDKPPEHEPWAGDIAHNYKKKFNHNDADYKDSTGVTAGAVDGPDKTLLSNPTDMDKEIRAAS